MVFFCLCGYSGGRWIRLVLLSCMMRIRLLLGFSCVIFFISRVSISMWRRLWISWLSYIWMVRFVFVLIWFGFLRMYVMLFVVLYGCIFVFWNIFFYGFCCVYWVLWKKFKINWYLLCKFFFVKMNEWNVVYLSLFLCKFFFYFIYYFVVKVGEVM